MAGNSRTISLKFTGDIADLVAAVAGGDAALKGFNKSASDTSGLEKLRADAEKLGYTLKQPPDTSGLDKLKADAKKLGVELEKIGKDDGDGFGSKLAKGMADGIEKAPILPLVIAGAVTAGLPIVAGAGAAAGAAVMVALGVAMQHNNPQITTAWSNLMSTFKDEATSTSSVMVGPISDALGSLTNLAKAEKPVLADLFQGAANDVPIFAQGIEGLVSRALPGFDNMVRSSGPIVEGFSSVLGDVGDTMSGIANTIAADAPEIENSLKGVGNFLKNDIGPAVSGLINVTSGLGQAWTTVVAYGSAFTDLLGGKSTKYALNDYQHNMGELSGKVRYFGNEATNAVGPVSGLQTAVKDLGDGLTQSKDDSQQFSDAIKTLGDDTTDTKSAVNAFQYVLLAMGQKGKEQALSFIAAATTDIDSMGKSFKKTKDHALNADGTINQFTASGAALQKQMASAQNDIGAVAESMHKAGYSTSEIRDAVNRLDTAIEQNLHKSLGISIADVQKMLASLGLMPDQMITTLNVTDNATPKVKGVSQEKIPDKWFTMFGDAGPATNSIGGVVSHNVPDKWFTMFGIDHATSLIDSVENALLGIHDKTFTITGNLNMQAGVLGLLSGGRASGGPVMAGRSYLVGEQGYEIFTPSVSGTIIPHGKSEAVVNGASADGAGSAGGDIVIQIGNETIARITQAQIDASNRRTKRRVMAGVGGA